MREEHDVSIGGQFQDPFTGFLWNITMSGGQDEEDGDSTDGPMWVARLGRHIVFQDSMGFVYRDKIDKGSDRDNLWAWIEDNAPDLAAWIMDEDAVGRQW